MRKFSDLVKLDEASYPGNIGFEEMVNFYQKADKNQITQMETIIKKNDWKLFKKLINDVLGIDLK